MCSMILLQIEVRDIGLQLSGRSFGSFLCNANMLATNQSSGNTPCNSNWLKMNVRIGAISTPSSFNIRGKSSSGPVDLLTYFRYSNIRNYSALWDCVINRIGYYS